MDTSTLERYKSETVYNLSEMTYHNRHFLNSLEHLVDMHLEELGLQNSYCNISYECSTVMEVHIVIEKDDGSYYSDFYMYELCHIGSTDYEIYNGTEDDSKLVGVTNVRDMIAFSIGIPYGNFSELLFKTVDEVIKNPTKYED